jgi:hypothetical protein
MATVIGFDDKKQTVQLSLKAAPTPDRPVTTSTVSRPRIPVVSPRPVTAQPPLVRPAPRSATMDGYGDRRSVPTTRRARQRRPSRGSRLREAETTISDRLAGARPRHHQAAPITASNSCTWRKPCLILKVAASGYSLYADLHEPSCASEAQQQLVAGRSIAIERPILNCQDEPKLVSPCKALSPGCVRYRRRHEQGRRADAGGSQRRHGRL